jgi:hypothetical protein
LEKEGGYECVVFEYPIEETVKAWENICEPALNTMMKFLKSENSDSRYKNVETIITPEKYLDRGFGQVNPQKVAVESNRKGTTRKYSSGRWMTRSQAGRHTM